METSELIKKVRRIEIKTRQLSRNVLSGEYHSSFQGRGMAFSEVRNYQVGDDIRSIDWNVTARKNEPFIKVFEEERERTLMLFVDVSASGQFGSIKQRKSELATELAATLAFSAIQNNDKVGVIFYTDQVERYIAPRKGRQHILTIIRELLEIEPKGTGTDLSKAIEYMNGVHKRRAIAMVISDFMDSSYHRALKVFARKHEVTALHISDEAELNLPSLGVIPIVDAESGRTAWINSSSKSEKRKHREKMDAYSAQLETTCKSSGIGLVNLSTNEDFAKALLHYFKSHGRR
ncbi:DUF58 domain-containing protein [Phaeocystidibacter luteus]|uniref:DUF58 domain-containing protein n=1 Tax=Phaeocystidibacter luteus TaxID=911197 RepID=A0A6N6REJ6_9FLAO|nr:DUF58 domain-containing protein [Phaeocystidibacter luteus]KAB2808596.1 DUF58 domain-containing protein [Phaeocystidibacter luteus]